MTHSSKGETPSPETAISAEAPSLRSSARLAHAVADLAIDKKARDLIVIDVASITSIADYIVILSGTSTRQILSIAQDIEAYAKKQGFQIISVEGLDTGRWVLIDFGDVIIHLMQDDVRAYYDLDGFWGDGEIVRRVPGDGIVA